MLTRKRNHGMTAIELIVVIGIISIMLGMGIYTFTRFGAQHKAISFMNQVNAMLRSTRNFAARESSTAFIVYNKDTRELVSIRKRLVGVWHFEDLLDSVTSGGQNFNGTVTAATLVPDGKFGRCFLFSGNADIKISAHHFFDARKGFTISAWIRRDRSRSTQKETILKKEGDIFFGIDNDNVLTVTVENETLQSIQKVPLHEWVYVQAIFDGRYLSLRMKSHTVAAKDFGTTLLLNPEPNDLHIGSKFNGRIDEVSYSIYDPIHSYIVPNELQFTITTGGRIGKNDAVITDATQEISRIHFNEQGQLDTLVNPDYSGGVVVNGEIIDPNKIVLDTVKFYILPGGTITGGAS